MATTLHLEQIMQLNLLAEYERLTTPRILVRKSSQQEDVRSDPDLYLRTIGAFNYIEAEQNGDLPHSAQEVFWRTGVEATLSDPAASGYLVEGGKINAGDPRLQHVQAQVLQDISEKPSPRSGEKKVLLYRLIPNENTFDAVLQDILLVCPDLTSFLESTDEATEPEDAFHHPTDAADESEPDEEHESETDEDKVEREYAPGGDESKDEDDPVC